MLLCIGLGAAGLRPLLLEANPVLVVLPGFSVVLGDDLQLVDKDVVSLEAIFVNK